MSDTAGRGTVEFQRHKDAVGLGGGFGEVRGSVD